MGSAVVPAPLHGHRPQSPRSDERDNVLVQVRYSTRPAFQEGGFCQRQPGQRSSRNGRGRFCVMLPPNDRHRTSDMKLNPSNGHKTNSWGLWREKSPPGFKTQRQPAMRPQWFSNTSRLPPNQTQTRTSSGRKSALQELALGYICIPVSPDRITPRYYYPLLMGVIISYRTLSLPVGWG